MAVAREAVAFSLRHGSAGLPASPWWWPHACKNASDCSKSFAVICSRLPIIVKMPMSSVLEERCAQLSGQ